MRVVIVEDERVLARNLQEYLGDFGFVVEVVNDGEDAWDVLVDEGFDCVVLDVNLPGKNGFEILTHMRDEGVKTPVLMLTALRADDYKTQGIVSTADDFVSKPFNPRELIARIKLWMEPKKAVDGLPKGDQSQDEAGQAGPRFSP